MSPSGHPRRGRAPETRDTGIFALAMILLLIGASCSSTYYTAYETFGIQKRDLLTKRVEAARDEEREAIHQFKDALSRLRQVYAFDDGNLETGYRSLREEYEECEAKADRVRERIADMELVAKDLFAEWSAEIEQISSESLQRSARQQFTETRGRYDAMRDALERSAQSMDPILAKLNDNVVYLKHNLNARAVSELKGQAKLIQADITRLVAQMDQAIQKADEFIASLD